MKLTIVCRVIQWQLLPHYPNLGDAKPTYSDFRPGDVGHSLADISKAANFLGYARTHCLCDSLA